MSCRNACSEEFRVAVSIEAGESRNHEAENHQDGDLGCGEFCDCVWELWKDIGGEG